MQGEVVDAFGAPLEGVQVSIPGTTFAATTDHKGRYSIAFAPGRFQVRFKLTGYTSASLEFDLATDFVLPAERVILAQVPLEQGVYGIGKTSYKMLARGTLVSESLRCETLYSDAPDGAFRPFFKETLKVAGDFTIVESGDQMAFLDTEPFSLSLLTVDLDGSVLEIWRSGHERQVFGFTLEESGVKVLAPDIRLRTFELPPGRFAFVHDRESKASRVVPRSSPVDDTTRISYPVYLFEVAQSTYEEKVNTGDVPLLALLSDQDRGGDCSCHLWPLKESQKGVLPQYIFYASMGGPAWVNILGADKKLSPVVPAPGCRSRNVDPWQEMRYRGEAETISLSLRPYSTCEGSECEGYGLRGSMTVRTAREQESIEIDGSCGC